MLSPGQSFDRYEVETLLGEGGMGRVYRARDTRLDRRVALKVVRFDDVVDTDRAELIARLAREARAAAKLEHPNAVVVHDVGEVDGTPYIVMEYLEGATLRERVGDTGATLDQRRTWLLDAARGLAHAHDRGIVHRDVKPENVMLTNDGRIKVLDFGIARRLGGAVDPTGPTVSPALPTLTRGAGMLGTTRYMSPEQVRGLALDGRSDQFSWGVMAYELFTGTPPFSGADALACAAAILTDEPPAMTTTPAEIESVVLRALQKRPERRFSSMHALIAALESEQGASLPPPAEAAPPSPKSPPSGGTPKYSRDQVSRILRRAVDLDQAQSMGLGRATLIGVAREIGLSPAAVDAAARELQHYVPDAGTASRSTPALRRHAAIWGVFVVFFFCVNLLTGGPWWFLWPALGWGLGLALHAVKVATAEPAGPKLVDEHVQAGAERLLDTARRLRVAPERARIATDVGHEESATESLPESAVPSPRRPRARRRG